VAKPRADIERFGYRFDTRGIAPAIVDDVAAEQREMLAEARSAA
jgi:hypothetical protein